MGVLKIAQLASVHAKEMACPVQNLASAGMPVRILTTTCGRTGMRTVKRTENSEIVLKSVCKQCLFSYIIFNFFISS